VRVVDSDRDPTVTPRHYTQKIATRNCPWFRNNNNSSSDDNKTPPDFLSCFDPGTVVRCPGYPILQLPR
jgi:hypothetical protein